MTAFVTAPPTATQAVADRYFAAWARRDAGAIAALHAPDSRFEVHGVTAPAHGIDAVARKDTFVRAGGR